MWPLEIGRPDIVRVGAHRIERWTWAKGWTCLGEADLPERGSAYAAAVLLDPLRRMVAPGSGKKALVAVIESALIPVILVDTGGRLWKVEQIEGLVRHHLRLTYGGPEAPVDAWQVRFDHRFGDRFALGFAAGDGVMSVLHDAARSAGTTWRGIVPAFAWAFDGVRRLRHGRWVLEEQDRSIVADLERGRITALNPAGMPLFAGSPCLALDDDDEDGSLTEIASWRLRDRRAASTSRVRWTTVEAVRPGSAKPAVAS